MSVRDNSFFVLIWLILGGCLTFNVHKVQAQGPNCGGVLEADSGDLEIQASTSSCLWIIKLQNMTGINLELKQLTMEPVIVIPEQNTPTPNLQSVWIVGPKNTHTFEGKMLVILAPSRNEKVSLGWSGLTVDTSEVTVIAKFEQNPQGTLLQWQQSTVGADKIFWAFEPKATGHLNWEMNSDLPYCGHANPCQCNSFGVVYFTPDGRIGSNNKTCEGSSLGSLNMENNSKILVLLHMNSSAGAGSNLQVKWKPTQKPVQKIIKGVAVGTEAGLYVVALNPPKTVKVSLKWVSGMAFDWNSKKIYWVEKGVGILRANLDGSDFELLIADQYAVGVGIESSTGNLYYGSNSRKFLRVCNNDAKKCSSIISLSEQTFDIALHLSKGLLFWSYFGSKIIRANLDGSNALVIENQASYGIYVDEHEERLYTQNRDTEEIISYDLNGRNLGTLRKVTIDPIDVEKNANDVYYSGYSSKSLYFSSKNHTSPALIATFTNSTRYIALFGEQDSLPRSNPCEKAKCSHLCVLVTASSYRCLCEDGQSLQKDGISCGIHIPS